MRSRGPIEDGSTQIRKCPDVVLDSCPPPRLADNASRIGGGLVLGHPGVNAGREAVCELTLGAGLPPGRRP